MKPGLLEHNFQKIFLSGGWIQISFYKSSEEPIYGKLHWLQNEVILEE
jgi:hypothetical protein